MRQPPGYSDNFVDGGSGVLPQHVDDIADPGSCARNPGPRRFPDGFYSSAGITRIDPARHRFALDSVPTRNLARRFLLLIGAACDRIETGGGQLERERQIGVLVSTPDRRILLRPDFLNKAFGQKLADCPFHRTEPRAGRGRQILIFALRGSAEQRELRIGEFNGHVRPFAFRTGPANPAPSLTQAPDRNGLRGWVSRAALSAARACTHMLTLEPKASPFSRKGRPSSGLEALETTNLGVRSSKLFGRARVPRGDMDTFVICDSNLGGRRRGTADESRREGR